MFEILAKFFRFSGRENRNKFKLSMVIGLVEALASAMKIPAIMYILIGLLGGKPIGKYIGGSLAIMVIAIVIAVICKRSSTVLQTEGGYNASAFTRIKIAEHLRYLPMGYFNSNSIGEISSVTTNTMEALGDIAARVVMLTTQGILETTMIVLMILIFDWRIGLSPRYLSRTCPITWRRRSSCSSSRRCPRSSVPWSWFKRRLPIALPQRRAIRPMAAIRQSSACMRRLRVALRCRRAALCLPRMSILPWCVSTAWTWRCPTV